MISERARPLVRAALEKRLREVAASRLPPPEGGRAGVGEPAPDPEEALRKIMVRLFPRLEELAKDEKARGELFALLLSLEEIAKKDDIRFLDAYNAVFENAPREAFRADPAWGAVLSAYARVLEAQVARLG